MSAPYYSDDKVTLYHGDCLEHPEWWTGADVLVTDPPYGIGYRTNAFRSPTNGLPRSIANDETTTTRDAALELWGKRPALVFGTWRVARPLGTRQVLIWDTKGALGMGALDLPWKPAHQEIYVIGSGFSGRRTTDVLSFAPVQAMAANGRVHPNEKPVPLMQALLAKCPPGTVADTFAGSGPTLIAAKALGIPAVGIELEERYCEIAARRLSQEVFNFEGLGA